MEWRSQRGSARTRCEPPNPSCLGMKVRILVVKIYTTVYMHGRVHVAYACE